MIRTEINPATAELAERLVALEKEAPILTEEGRLATCRVCEKLRRPLSHLVGTTGVSVLLQRALALAKRESPALQGVQVLTDGRLRGLEGEAAGAISVLIAHLIQLLTTFIGEELTFKLLHDVWPEMNALDVQRGKGGYEEQSSN